MIDPRAAAIADARRRNIKLAEYPGVAPLELDEAVAIQADVIKALGETVRGWKIGCTSEVAQKALGADGPFFGPILNSRCFDNGAIVSTGPNALRIIEAEVALTLAHDIHPRNNPYSLDEVLAAIGHVHAALEIVNRRLPGGLDQGLNWNIADCGVNDAIVLGDGMLPLDRDEFANVTVSVLVNGTKRTSGTGRTALGGAHHALHWLVNEFSQREMTLRAGDIISTGLITEIIMADIGDQITAEYAQLGSLNATIE